MSLEHARRAAADHAGPWLLYCVGPFADAARADGSRLATTVGVLCALGGLASHALQAWARVRESAARVRKIDAERAALTPTAEPNRCTSPSPPS